MLCINLSEYWTSMASDKPFNYRSGLWLSYYFEPNFDLKQLFEKGTEDLYAYGKKLTFHSFTCNYTFRSANGL